MKQLKGVIAPLTTPFYESGEFAYPMLETNIERYSVSGVHGYLALGPIGECKTISANEKLEIVRCVARRMGKNQFLIAVNISESTKETIETAKRMENLGADYIALLAPSYHVSQMNDEVLFRYFSDAAMAVDVPCILCNAPRYTGGLSISQRVIKMCFEHPNIIGIMDLSPSGIEKLICDAPDEFKVLSGTASSFLSALINGAAGGVAPLADSYPVMLLDVYDAYINGDYSPLTELNRKMIRLDSAITDAYGIAAIKYAMDKNGFSGGFPRLPLLPLSDSEKAGLDDDIDRIIG